MGRHPKKPNNASWQSLAKTFVKYLLLKYTMAEEVSLLDPVNGSATVSDSMAEGGVVPMNLIDSDFTEEGEYITDSMSPDDVEISIQNLPADTRVTIAFIQQTNWDLSSTRLSKSRIYMGNDSTPASTALAVCSDYFYDGGFIDVWPSCQGGTDFTIRRDGLPPTPLPITVTGYGETDPNPNSLKIVEVRLYQAPNLLTKFGGVRRAADPDNGEQIILSCVPDCSSSTSILNLSQNFRARSYRVDRKAFVGDNFEEATYDTCSVVSDSVGDNKYEMTYTFPEPVTFHSVLMVTDSEMADDPDVAIRFFEVFIYSLNDVIPGTPSCSLKNHDGIGGEAWCNRIGQKITIKYTKSYDWDYIKICSLGIFGSIYEPSVPV